MNKRGDIMSQEKKRRKRKWEKFSKEELAEKILNSKTYKEALIKIGYNGDNTGNNKIIKEIAEKYNISLEHFSTGSYKDLTGQKFGRLTVLKKVETKNGGFARWLCQCECGSLKEVDGIHLRRGETTSCGCYCKEQIIKNNIERIEDLTGKKFGKLTVLKRADNIGLQPAWYCKCECGTYTNPIMASNLKKGTTMSCGCLSSKGELKIRQIFIENNINFKTQVSFNDCKYKDKLRFDFGVYNQYNELIYLVEFNGRQHYEEINFFEESLVERQTKDNIKINYCKNNNIPLIIIPYHLYEKMSMKDLSLESKYFI